MENPLREYQQRGYDGFVEWFNHSQERNAIFALATGLGKTRLGSACVDYVVKGGGKVLWLAHREELIDASRDELIELTGAIVSVEQGARRWDPQNTQVVVASVATLTGNRLGELVAQFNPSLIVCDEAHHGVAPTWLAIKAAFPAAKILNLTATPYRVDISQRLDLGTVLVEMNTTDGIKAGYLVPPEIVENVEVKLKGINPEEGEDYEVSALSRLLCSKVILDVCVKAVIRNVRGKKAILFAASVKHGQKLAAEFRKVGITVGEVYGTTPTEERKAIYKGVKEGSINILINNLVCTEGFNLPELDMVIILRPTKSAALYLQMLGRGLRSAKWVGKTKCDVIDLIDSEKHTSSKKKDLILPSASDIAKAESIEGRTLSAAHVFLMRWLPAPDDTKLSKLETPDHLMTLFYPVKSMWELPPIQKVRREIEPVFTARTAPTQKENTGYQELLSAFGLSNLEVFCKMLSASGYAYCPGLKPADKQKWLDLHKESARIGAGETSQFTLGGFLDHDTRLKNFILDIFSSSKNEKSRVLDRYVFLFPDDRGRDLFWYVSFRQQLKHIKYFMAYSELGYRYLWVKRTDAGKPAVFRFRPMNKYVYALERINETDYSVLPATFYSHEWANKDMTPKQAELVAKLLKVTPAEAQELRLTSIEASALMSATYNAPLLRMADDYIDEKLSATTVPR